MNIPTNVPGWVLMTLYLVLLIVTGVAEYFHIVPPNTFYTILLLIVGHGAATSLFPGILNTQVSNTQATQENTQAVQANTHATLSMPIQAPVNVAQTPQTPQDVGAGNIPVVPTQAPVNATQAPQGTPLFPKSPTNG